MSESEDGWQRFPTVPLDPRFHNVECRSADTRVIGTYLSPTVMFREHSDINPSPGYLTAIIRKVPVNGLELLITRIGGVFVSLPASLRPFWADDPPCQSRDQGRVTVISTLVWRGTQTCRRM